MYASVVPLILVKATAAAAVMPSAPVSLVFALPSVRAFGDLTGLLLCVAPPFDEIAIVRTLRLDETFIAMLSAETAPLVSIAALVVSLTTAVAKAAPADANDASALVVTLTVLVAPMVRAPVADNEVVPMIATTATLSMMDTATAASTEASEAAGSAEALADVITFEPAEMLMLPVLVI
jgi:hypothetical protein